MASHKRFADQSVILAIDTSCDETSAAVVVGNQVWSNVVASQIQLHKQYGGVFPTVAKQAHLENITPTVNAALQKAGVRPDELDGIAVTQGPGLAPALEVGIDYAKQIAATWQKPLFPVNHIEGHILSVLVEPKPKGRSAKDKTEQPQFPVLSIIISGKHSDFILVKGIGQYERLGFTLDDAAGEALDKFGRMVGLGYPAGPLVEEFGRRGDEHAYTFPLPMTDRKDYMLSFSGLKTAARRMITEMESVSPLTATQVDDLCASYQYAVFRLITYKLHKLLKEMPVNEVWLGGGVAANITLRETLRETLADFGLSLKLPYTRKLCGDNAAMIGVAVTLKLDGGQAIESTDLNLLERKPRWEIS